MMNRLRGVGDDDTMPLYVHMSSRDPTQGHRGSSPLELFFDLTFVVAVAQAGSAFQRGLVGNEAGTVLTGYPLVFFRHLVGVDELQLVFFGLRHR